MVNGQAATVNRNGHTTRSKIVAEYDYRDEAGAVVFQTVRLEPKDFRQRRPDGAGGWHWNLNDTRRVPYHLPELLARPGGVAFIVEGEKDADNLVAVGLLATTCPMGASKWGLLEKDAVQSAFKIRPVVIVPDNDDPGHAHAEAVAADLYPVATSVKIVTLPGLAPKGDVSDWLAAGGTADELQKLAVAAPRWWPRGQNGSAAGVSGERKPADVPEFTLLDSAEFSAATYRRDWLIRGALVRNQPGVIGGPAKGMKTCLAVDAAVSLGTATPFLGSFVVPTVARVALLSGESGEATLQETAVRVCAAKNINLSDAAVLWGFRLPQLANPLHLDALRLALEREDVEVLLLDPLYLSLLAGTGGDGPQASNLYQTGPLLLAIAEACLSIGCTPILVHHYKLTRADPLGEPQLADLAYSGIQEFARQWLLVGRRERYEPGTGQHRLWMSVGGSSGHSGLWHVDVDEGTVDEDFRGRKWNVTVTAAHAARQCRQDERAAAARDEKLAAERADDAAVMAALDKLSELLLADGSRRGGATKAGIQAHVGFSRDRAARAINRLLAEEVIEPAAIVTETGKTKSGEVALRQDAGFRRKRE